MKLSILFMFCALIVVALANEDDSQDKKEFREFQAKFRKHYRSSHLEEKSFRNFRKAQKEIKEHNEKFAKGEETYEKGINQFSDLSQDEIDQIAYGAKLPKDVEEEVQAQKRSDDDQQHDAKRQVRAATQDFDLRKYYNKVHNQGQCGSCWTFSASTAMEFALAIKNGRQEELSEQFYVDCVNDGQSHGCNGGWPTSAWDLTNNKGSARLSTDYPYYGRQTGVCYNTRASSTIKRVTYHRIPANRPDEMSKALRKSALAAAIYASPNFTKYKGGFFRDTTCSRYRINHAVTIIGEKTVNGQEYWLVQNSWGTTWGDNGTILLPKRSPYNCHLEEYVYYVEVN